MSKLAGDCFRCHRSQKELNRIAIDYPNNEYKSVDIRLCKECEAKVLEFIMTTGESVNA